MNLTLRHPGTPRSTAPRSAALLPAVTLASALAITLAGCSGMSHRDESTAVGAGAGAVAGAILTGGSSVGTVGGAVVGGVIGNSVDKK